MLQGLDNKKYNIPPFLMMKRKSYTCFFLSYRLTFWCGEIFSQICYIQPLFHGQCSWLPLLHSAMDQPHKSMSKMLQASMSEYHFAIISYGYKGGCCGIFLRIWKKFKKIFYISFIMSNDKEITTKCSSLQISVKVAKGYIPFATVIHRYKVLVLHGNGWLLKICTYSWNRPKIANFIFNSFN